MEMQRSKHAALLTRSVTCTQFFQGFALRGENLFVIKIRRPSPYLDHKPWCGFWMNKNKKPIQWTKINNGEVIYDFHSSEMFLFPFVLYCRLISLIYLSSTQNKSSAIFCLRNLLGSFSLLWKPFLVFAEFRLLFVAKLWSHCFTSNIDFKPSSNTRLWIETETCLKGVIITFRSDKPFFINQSKAPFNRQFAQKTWLMKISRLILIKLLDKI